MGRDKFGKLNCERNIGEARSRCSAWELASLERDLGYR